MRRGREVYSRKYEEAIKLHGEGKSIHAIAKELKISYSAAYHWIKGLRKPAAGNVNAFAQFLRDKGPQPAEEIKDLFPKHNELFLIASRRGLKVKRLVMGKELRSYAVWYLLDGQENELKLRVEAMLKQIKGLKDKLRDILSAK